MSREQRKVRRTKEGKFCIVCKRKAHGRCGYCLGHLPDKLRCVRTTLKGKRCKLPIVKDANVCKVHLNVMERGYGKGKYGWVYIYDTAFRRDGRGIYKIGRSANPTLREQEFRSCNPYGRMLFAGFVGGQARQMEGELHRRYRDSWVEKELFALTGFEVDEIRLELYRVATIWEEVI